MRRLISTLIFFMVGFFSHSAHAWTLVGSGYLGWNTNRLAIHVNPSNCGVSETTLYSIVDRAISAWNGVPTANVTLFRHPIASSTDVSSFMNGSAQDVPLLVCDTSFSTTLSVDGNFIPAATLKLQISNEHLSYGGMVLNAESSASASLPNLSETEFEITVAHEMGHVLGLGHSGVTDALMYYSISGKKSMVLTRDDRLGLSYLYPRNEFRAQPFGCAAAHRDDTSPVDFLDCLTAIAWLVATVQVGRSFRPARLLLLPG